MGFPATAKIESFPARVLRDKGRDIGSIVEDPVVLDAESDPVSLLTGTLTLGARNYEFAGVVSDGLRVATMLQQQGKSEQLGFVTPILVYKHLNQEGTHSYDPVPRHELPYVIEAIKAGFPNAPDVKTLPFATYDRAFQVEGANIPLGRRFLYEPPK